MQVGSLVKIINPINFYFGRMAMIDKVVPINMYTVCYWVRICGTSITCLERANELELVD